MKHFEFVEVGCYEYKTLIQQKIEHIRANDIPHWEAKLAEVKCVKKTFLYDPKITIERYESYLENFHDRIKELESLLCCVNGVHARPFFLSDEQMRYFGAY